MDTKWVILQKFFLAVAFWRSTKKLNLTQPQQTTQEPKPMVNPKKHTKC